MSAPRPASSARHAVRCRITFGAALFVFAAVAAWLVVGRHLPELARLGIPIMEPRFADARAISGASVSLAQGFDPLVHNPGDHMGRPMNYPRTWLLLAHLGLGPQHTDWLALAFAGVFGLGLLTLLPLAGTRRTVALLVAALFSPVVWLGIERANNDLPVFGLVAIGAWLVTRHPRWAAGCLLSAGLLKLFPIFALPGHLVSGPRRTLRLAGVTAALFALWVWWTRADLALIRAGTYHWNRIGYGIDQIATSLAGRGLPELPLLIASIGVLAAAVISGLRWRARLRLASTPAPAALAAFRCGAGVHIGTFCLGSNFDYRLVFLLLTLPQLGHWTERGTRRSRGWVWSLLTAALLLLWSMTWRSWLVPWCGEGPGLIVDELCSWWLVLGLAVALVLALPDSLVPRSWRGQRALDAEAVVKTWPPLPAFVGSDAGRRRDTGA
jgi:hypothetical protein